jgi:hypothetical protein
MTMEDTTIRSNEDIKCPRDLNRYIINHPFEDTFPHEDCEKNKAYGDCYHCFASAIAYRDRQVKAGIEEDTRKRTLEDFETWLFENWNNISIVDNRIPVLGYFNKETGESNSMLGQYLKERGES